MKYTCDLLDKSCTDKMAEYNLIIFLISIIFIGTVWFVSKWWDKRKKERREKGKQEFPECIDRCNYIYTNHRPNLLDCYRNCSWHTFR